MGNKNKEEHYFYFDRTFIVNKFEGPYKLNSYPYQNKIDNIYSFIVEELDVKPGFELLDKYFGSSRRLPTFGGKCISK